MKVKRTTMKRASIFTENDEHANKDKDYLGLPIMSKGSSVPYIRNKVVEIPVEERSSGAFLDFNTEWTATKFKNRHNRHQILSYYGNGGRGNFRHDKGNQLEEIEDLKFKTHKGTTHSKLDIVETIKEEQRTTNGAEIAGKEAFSQQKALEEIRKTMVKRNRGGRSGKRGGAYQGGHMYNIYNEAQVFKDNEFQKLNEEQKEFRTITEGIEDLENYGNLNIKKGFI